MIDGDRTRCDVVCLGEALIDLVPTRSGVGLAEADTFVKAAGGAPANVAAGLARLGIAAAFVGMIGADAFGRFLADTLATAGVATQALRVTPAAPTALAAVALQSNGERDFVFYGNPPAHALLRPADVDAALIARAKILHVGSISLIDEPAHSATLHAIALAHANGVRVSFDPNLRLSLWPDAEAARSGLRMGLAEAEIVKIAEEELAFLAPDACDPIEAARALWHPRLSLMTVTRGARGCLWLDAYGEGEVAGFAVEAVDTTGAGDAFTAALLACLARNSGLVDDADALGAALRFANAAGALATTRRGAIPALPDRGAIEALLAQS